MCHSAEVSFGVALVLLPVSGYCLAVAAAKDRAYLSLAAVPLLLGVQQLCEAAVQAGMERGDSGLSRAAASGFLFLALAVWPVWVPLAAAALEAPGRRRAVFLGLGAAGLMTVGLYALPVADGGWAAPQVAGHGLRFDLPDPGLVWPAVYLAAVCGPLAASRAADVRPLGWLVLAAAAAAYTTAPEAFASTWGRLASVGSGYVAYVLYQLPDSRQGKSGTGVVAQAL